MSKDRDGPWKETGFIHIFVQGWAGPPFPSPSSPTIPCPLEPLLPLPSCDLSRHSYMYCLGDRGNARSRLLRRRLGTSCVAFKQLKFWGKVRNIHTDVLKKLGGLGW